MPVIVLKDRYAFSSNRRIQSLRLEDQNKNSIFLIVTFEDKGAFQVWYKADIEAAKEDFNKLIGYIH